MGVAVGALRGELRGHRHAGHAVGAERVDGDAARRAPSRSRPRARARRARSRSCRRSRACRARARPRPRRRPPSSSASDAAPARMSPLAGGGGREAAEVVDARRVPARAPARWRVSLQPRRAGGLGVDVADQQLLRELAARAPAPRRRGRRRASAPSKTSSSCPPTSAQKATAATASLARWAIIGSRASPLPAWYGEAEMLTISCAPASASSVAGGPGTQMSSQTVSPTVTPSTSISAAARAALEVAVLVEDAVVGQAVLAVDRRGPRRRRAPRRRCRRRRRARGSRRSRRCPSASRGDPVERLARVGEKAAP